MNPIDKKLVEEFAVKTSLQKVLKADTDKLKSAVISIVNTEGIASTEKSKDLEVTVKDEDTERKYKITLTNKTKTELSDDFALLVREQPEVTKATIVSLSIPYEDLRRLCKDNVTLKEMFRFKTGYAIDGTIFGNLVAEKAIKEPEKFYKEKAEQAVSVKVVK